MTQNESNKAPVSYTHLTNGWLQLQILSKMKLSETQWINMQVDEDDTSVEPETELTVSDIFAFILKAFEIALTRWTSSLNRSTYNFLSSSVCSTWLHANKFLHWNNELCWHVKLNISNCIRVLKYILSILKIIFFFSKYIRPILYEDAIQILYTVCLLYTSRCV